jgi:regulator of protease activity HflC (stomatin/prohibitin superfamily)
MMKRSETIAWTAFAALLALAVVMLVGGLKYNANVFWVGLCLCGGQSLVVGLAAWGLRLANQRAELEELSPPTQPGRAGFRMSYEENTPSTAGAPELEAKTLDTSFQRLVVGLSAIVLLTLAGVVGFLMYRSFSWHNANLDQPFPIAGNFDKPRLLDELALLMILASAAAYVAIWSITRVRRDTVGTGEAVNSNFTLGLPAMVALGIAGSLAYLRVTYATEVAAAITLALMSLQGLELMLNAFRSFSAVEELDQPAVNLQALPLVPMLSSVWLSDVRILFAQSVGLSTSKEKGVMGRIMPRAILAIILIAIVVSCLREVPAGKVAVIERLGRALQTPDGKSTLLLEPGLHLTFPWPIDQLVMIPNHELQLTDVGVKLHGDKNLASKSKVDFQFWTYQPPDSGAKETEGDDQFVTGDPGGQILETYVAVLWRVKEPVQFYSGLSHSEFYDKTKKSDDKAATKVTPIYVELVQQCTSFAVTRAFATHTLDQIMNDQRQAVEARCKEILQKQLDDAGAGIQIVSLNITDLHPPLGEGDVPLNPARPEAGPRGPAHAYENIVNMMQTKELLIQRGVAQQIAAINQAEGTAATDLNDAHSYYAERVADAKGEADRIGAMIGGFPSLSETEMRFMTDLAKRQAMYSALKDTLNPVNKIIVDPRVNDIQLYQVNEKSQAPRQREVAGAAPGQPVTLRTTRFWP